MFNNYDDTYMDNVKVFGDKPTDCVVEAIKLIHDCTNKTALDVGAGQGRNSKYLLDAGFRVVAIDNSPVACQQLSSLGYDDIEVVNKDVFNFNFELNKYDLILFINVLHFLDKDKAITVLNRAKNSLKPFGIMAISILLDNGKFKNGELKNMFADDNYEIVTYSEANKLDRGHPGSPKPHEHRIAVLITRLKRG